MENDSHGINIYRFLKCYMVQKMFHIIHLLRGYSVALASMQDFRLRGNVIV
jgi:hypothetical protein